MSTTTLTPPPYHEAREQGEVTNRSGWHKPGSYGGNRGFMAFQRRKTQPDNPDGCDCDLVTDKGAYRDETVRLPDGRRVHYYHQHPVVVVDGDTYRISSCGYKTATTKERINRYLPSGYRVYQEDLEWFLSVHDPNADYDERDPEVREFSDGMAFSV